MSNISSLKAFAANLRTLPRVVAQKVAAAAAPALTDAARETFNAGENAYGLAWDPKADGARATLKQSGALASKIVYVAVGTKIRTSLGTEYAKYVVGKRPVLPTQAGQLPASYQRALASATAEVCAREIGQ